MYRREFIRLASFASGAITFAGSFAGQRNAWADPSLPSKPLSSEDLYQLFAHPSAAYRPMVRWWWNGDRVTPKELVRELDVLKNASIGGVEINPIRFPSEADPLDTKSLLWMSDGWIAALETVLRGAKERGMVCDMIVGSGWPFGGEFLSRNDQIQMVALGTRDLMGPQTVRLSRKALIDEVSPRFTSPYEDPLKELLSASIVPYDCAGVDAAHSIDLGSGEDTIAIDVPAGRYVLYFLVRLTGFMAVINGAPGASGPVLNHYNVDSVSRYLNRISDRLIAKIGPLHEYLRAFFTDSIELEGANWCDDMLAEFRRRREYDLAPYLPFVLFKVGEMGNAVAAPYGAHLSAEFKEKTERVRYDFETTRRELFNERFVATFADWCRKIGVKSRMQAYGRECDPISGSMMIDIPECETWLHKEEIEPFGDGPYTQGRSYSMINKFVSSAAHLAGKSLISCEEMTNTEDPFHTTLDRIKVAGDQSILSGVTQSVLHGFNYSPPDAPFPGWVRYGTYFSERNPWWPYFHLWADYRSRISALLQHGEMQADIAILPPQADMAAKFGFQRDPFPSVVYPPYLFKLWEVIHQNGSGCDYVSEEILSKSIVQRGRLSFNSRSYKAIFLPDVSSLQPQTATQLRSFVASGGTVLFLDAVPDRSSGLANAAGDDKEVATIIAAMRKDFPERTPLVSVREKDMVGWYKDLQRRYALTPDVVIDSPTDFVSQVHYRIGEVSVFFFSHYGPEERQTIKATFQQSTRRAWLWNPETGERSLLQRKNSDGSFTLSLGPSQSGLVVLESGGEETRGKAVEDSRSISPGRETDISNRSEIVQGPWTVRLQHVDGTDRTITAGTVASAKEQIDSQGFAGTITYTSKASFGSGGLPATLSLRRVYSVTELTVNDQVLGVRWYGDHVYSVKGALKPGANSISIKVITTLGNYMQTLKDNRTARHWTKGTPRAVLGLPHEPRWEEVG
jgi:hypothetical protein